MYDKKQKRVKCESCIHNVVCEWSIYNAEIICAFYIEKRPQGEWQLHGMIYYCSVCGHECGESGDNFCGNCGADMRGDDTYG